MKICQVVESASGGTGRHVIDLTHALHARGHELTLIYSPLRVDPVFAEALASMPARVVSMPMQRAIGWRDVAAVRRLGEIVRELGPFAVIHGHSSKAGAIVRLARVGGAARIYTPHALATLDLDRAATSQTIVRSVEKLLGARRTDALILLSTNEYREAERLGLAGHRRHLIANRLYGFNPMARSAARATLGAPENARWIGFVGRLCQQKAPLLFVAAVIGAMRRHADVHALILGDGEQAPFVAEAIQASGFAERFAWHRNGDVGATIAALDLMLITSRFEGAPYVLLEALSAGVPVLSSDVGSARDLLDDGAGIVCTAERIPRELLALLTDPVRLRRMRVAAAGVGVCCGASDMIDATEQLYEQVASAA